MNKLNKHTIKNLTTSKSFTLYIMLIGLFLYVISDTISKIYLQHYTVEQISLIRSCARLLPLLLYSLFTLQNPYKSINILLQITRALFASLVTYVFIYASKLADLSEVYTISYLSPIFIVLFSFIFLKEKITQYIVIAVLIGFCGSVFIFNPNFGNIGAGGIFAVIGAVLSALNQIFMKKILLKDSNLSLMLYHNTFLLLLSFCLCETWPTPFPWELFYMYSILATSGQYLITYAIANTFSNTLASLNYSTIIPVCALEFFMYAKFPNLNVIIGLIFILISNFIIIYFNQNKQQTKKEE